VSLVNPKSSSLIVIEAQDAHTHIAEQLLKDERIFGVMQKMVAKMVGQKFQQPGA
jgi:type I restriction enzyme R subunit